MVDLNYFAGLNFADASTHAHYIILYNQAFFAGKIFMVRQSSVKQQRLDPSKISRYMVVKLFRTRNLSLCAKQKIFNNEIFMNYGISITYECLMYCKSGNVM